MSITQEWDNPQMTVYRIAMSAPWTWADFDAAIDEGNRILATQAPARVSLILWLNGALPLGNAVPHLRHAAGNQPRNSGHTVIVNESGLLLERMIETLFKTKRWEGCALVKTIAEARALLSG